MAKAKKHDYGQGFYLTENIDLAKEWAVCRPNDENGYVHQYELAYSKLHEVEGGLQIVAYKDFNEKYNRRDITAR